MITRRQFIRTVGRGSMAVAVVGITACGTDEPAATTPGETLRTPAPSTTTSSVVATSTSGPATTGVTEPASEEWRRVNLGFVSAYVFVRGGEAALVDTGTSGSAPQVESTLGDLGLGWADLSTIVLTHQHGDHVGSLSAIMDAAPNAVAYAGAEDIPSIPSPRQISAVSDGDSVFGLEVIATPGHTPGHISILDPTGVLLAGDAIVGEGGGVAGPPAQFTADPDTANASIAKLAGFDYEIVYFGHGEPVTTDGSDQVAEFAAGL